LRALLLEDHVCQGRITREHALYYAGKRLDEVFAIIFLCSYAHSVDEFQDIGILDKEINEWIAINRMTEEDMNRYSKFDWRHRKRYLNDVYGVPHLPTI
jgi:hypothetical protein